jgi:hypothetical protein
VVLQPVGVDQSGSGIETIAGDPLPKASFFGIPEQGSQRIEEGGGKRPIFQTHRSVTGGTFRKQLDLTLPNEGSEVRRDLQSDPVSFRDNLPGYHPSVLVNPVPSWFVGGNVYREGIPGRWPPPETFLLGQLRILLNQ